MTRSDAVLALATAFRRHGYAAASLTSISEHTGLGKGSLYHFFPGGKADMAAAVLEQVGDWFEREVYQPLRSEGPAADRVNTMVDAVEDYFVSRHLVCLFAVFAIGHEQELFAERLRRYFADWIDALTEALGGRREPATEAVATIQGSLVLARALNDETVFRAGMTRLRASLAEKVL